MAQKITNTTFNINIPSTPLNVGDKLIFKFQMKGNTTNNFTASVAVGNLKVNSLAASAGSTSTPLQFFSGSGTIFNPETDLINIPIDFIYPTGKCYGHLYLQTIVL